METCTRPKPNRTSIPSRDFNIILTLDNDINMLIYCKVLWWDRHKGSIRITMNPGHNRRAFIARQTKQRSTIKASA